MCYLLQGCVSGEAQGHWHTLCHEESEQTSDGHEETGPAGVLREGHPHIRREPVRGGTLVHLPNKGSVIM